MNGEWLLVNGEWWKIVVSTLRGGLEVVSTLRGGLEVVSTLRGGSLSFAASSSRGKAGP